MDEVETVPQEIWQQCLELLQDEFPSQQFNTWLRPLQSRDDGGVWYCLRRIGSCATG